MTASLSQAPVIVIAGPTASGKSAFAVELAKRLGGEIISADSRQVYRDINLGTGKPPERLLRQVPHHMISTLPLTEPMSADQYASQAYGLIQTLSQQGKPSLVVGGSGLWIRALIDGLAPLPPKDDHFRATKKVWSQTHGGPQALYQELSALDPETADGINPHDELRIIRALEIYHLTGEQPSQLKSKKNSRPALNAIWLGLDHPREDLYRRAETNVDLWLAQGWVKEVEHLLRSIPQALEQPGCKAIGIQPIVDYLSHRCSYDESVALIKRDTRRYIKRQLTWFKKNQRLLWLRPHELLLAYDHIQRWMANRPPILPLRS